MRATGIIAEYNPFHNGHAYQAAQARQLSHADAVIAVMSGHFTQRGEITLIDKWHRAQTAILSGVDLVLELPAVFAVRSAQYFAAGGVRLLNSLGIVGHLSFGAEVAEMDLLKAAAIGMSDPMVVQALKQGLRSGKTYAAALAQALVIARHTTRDFIISPNNILAVEYLRAIGQYAPCMQPLPVSRIGSGYHDRELADAFSSATSIRQEIYQRAGLSQALCQTMPLATVSTLIDLLKEGTAPAKLSCLDNVILSKLRRIPQDQLFQTPEVSEGLENRLRRVALQTGSAEELLTLLKTKRYPFSRLQRILIHLLLGTQSSQINEFDTTGPLYARVLAMNEQGQAALRAISRRGTVPIITKTTSSLNSRTYHSRNLTPLQTMLAIDITATDLFTLCLPNPEKRQGGLDFRRSAIHCRCN